MVRVSLTFFLTLALCASFAQKTLLSGVAPGAEGKLIVLSRTGDLISNLEVILASAPVDSTGQFSFAFDLDETSLVTISIDFHKAEMYMEPGTTYRVNIGARRYDVDTEINPFIQAQKLTLEPEETNEQELNMLIARFNAEYNAFMMENFNALYRDRNKNLLDTFRLLTNQTFGEAVNPWFKNYITYKIASLEQLTRYYNPQKIGSMYFTVKPILYRNVEYMDFFNSYFSKYITATNNTLRKLDYRSLLGSPDSYSTLMKSLSTDTLLKPEQLRELVLLKGAMDLYNTADYYQKDVIRLIGIMAEKSKSEKNREVAANILKVLTHLKPGTQAPYFKLVSQYQTQVSLDQFEGKPVVLNFWTTYCEGCIAEMDLLKPIYDKFGTQVHFVSISADKYIGKMLHFVNLKKEYVWNFLNIGDQTRVLKDYDVRSYPLFVLIDEKGKIVRYPAAWPSKGLEAEIQQFLIR